MTGGIIAPVTPPLLSRAAALALSCLADPTPGITYPPPSPAVRAELLRAVPALEAACRTLTAEALDAWLKPLALSVGNPRSPEQRRTFAELAVHACNDLPGGVLTADSQRAALRAFEFWPSVAALDKLLRPLGAPILGRLAALRRLAAEQSRPLDPEPATARNSEVERMALAARFTAWRHGTGHGTAGRGMRDEMPRERPRPLHASPADLHASYQARAHLPGPAGALARARLALPDLAGRDDGTTWDNGTGGRDA